MGKQWKQWQTLFIYCLQNHCRWWLQPWNQKRLAPWKKCYGQPRLKRHYLANEGPSSQSYGFSRSHVWMWELDHKEGWVPKTWCFQAGCWRRLLRVPWTTRRLSQSILREINPEEDIGQNDAEAPKLWPPDVKSWLSGKDPDNGEDWRHEEKGMAEMVGWYHWLNGHEFQQALEDSEGQRSLTCCSSWGRKELDTTEWLNKIHTTWWDKLVWLKKQRLQRDRLWFICHLCYFPTGSNYSIMPLLLLLLLQSHFSHVRLCATP